MIENTKNKNFLDVRQWLQAMVDRVQFRARLAAGAAAVCWIAAAAEVVPPLAKIADSKLIPTVEKRIAKLQPTRQERRFDEIGWSTSLVAAKRIGRERGRPIFVFT